MLLKAKSLMYWLDLCRLAGAHNTEFHYEVKSYLPITRQHNACE